MATHDPVALNLAAGPDELGPSDDTHRCSGCGLYVTEDQYDADISLCLDCADADLERQVWRISGYVTGHDKRILRRAARVLCRHFGVEVPK